MGVAIAALFQASPRLTVAMLVLATVLGLLQPAFVIATGVLVQAAASGASIVLPLTILGVIFGLTRVIGPLRDQLGLVHALGYRSVAAAAAFEAYPIGSAGTVLWYSVKMLCAAPKSRLYIAW